MAVVSITWEWTYLGSDNERGFWMRQHFWLDTLGQRFQLGDVFSKRC